MQLGGPAFRIGIGGGAASSRDGGQDEQLDFNSVQRDNAEMQRRAQSVLDALRHRPDNPILSLHDVGAGGLANAVSELVHAAERGAQIDLSAIPVAQAGMTAAEIWCNESQERYVLALAEDKEPILARLCHRERCPHAVIGAITEARTLIVTDPQTKETPVNLPLADILDLPDGPPLTRRRRPATRHRHPLPLHSRITRSRRHRPPPSPDSRQQTLPHHPRRPHRRRPHRPRPK